VRGLLTEEDTFRGPLGIADGPRRVLLPCPDKACDECRASYSSASLAAIQPRHILVITGEVSLNMPRRRAYGYAASQYRQAERATGEPAGT
jgi:hypothetical protein